MSSLMRTLVPPSLPSPLQQSQQQHPRNEESSPCWCRYAGQTVALHGQPPGMHRLTAVGCMLCGDNTVLPAFSCGTGTSGMHAQRNTEIATTSLVDPTPSGQPASIIRPSLSSPRNVTLSGSPTTQLPPDTCAACPALPCAAPPVCPQTARAKKEAPPESATDKVLAEEADMMRHITQKQALRAAKELATDTVYTRSMSTGWKPRAEAREWGPGLGADA